MFIPEYEMGDQGYLDTNMQFITIIPFLSHISTMLVLKFCNYLNHYSFRILRNALIPDSTPMIRLPKENTSEMMETGIGMPK